jgi:membrane-anchored protein YejM (alkaline phosphatase superfamily)
MPAEISVSSDGPRTHGDAFGRILLASWVLMLLNTSRDLRLVSAGDALAVAWLGAAWLIWSLAYVLAIIVPIALVVRLLDTQAAAKLLGAWRRRVCLGLFVVAALGLAAVQLFIYADAEVFHVFGFHINGFVWNLITVPGGIESMGADPGTLLAFVALAVLALAVEGAIVWYALRGRWPVRSPMPAGRWRVLTVLALVVLLGFERVTLGLSDAANERHVLAASSALPLTPPIRMHAIAKALGFQAPEGDESETLQVSSGRLHYPLAELHRAPDAPRWNVLWLTSESLRADMLDPEIMPATTAFAAGALDFRHHYSGGNGTRMGMFAMFYSLYGPYWFPFLGATRRPALLELLEKDGWDIEAWTSAKFSFPEFDETIWSGVPASRLHEGNPDKLGWENDRANVSAMLAAIDAHDPGKPFFDFMFFESPHARYYFPPESVIREPYLPELNYATVNLEKDMPLVKARYVNACHHLDSQLARVFDHLREHGLLDHTIVIVTGDHGEEFMERGRWGHHSDFSDEQTRTPFVLWVPGQAPRRIEAWSSHLDIAPTLAARLGVQNPPEDWCLGLDLLTAPERTNVVVGDWDHLALFDANYKAVFATGSSPERVVLTDPQLHEVDNAAPFWAANRGRVSQMLEELGRFRH